MRELPSMKLSAILRYAVIGARYESEAYQNMSDIERHDRVKAEHFNRISNRCGEDAVKLARIYAKLSESEIEVK